MILHFDTDLCSDGELRALAEIYWRRADHCAKLAAEVPPDFEEDFEEHRTIHQARADELEAIIGARREARIELLRKVANGRPTVVPCVKVGDMVRPCFNGYKGYTQAGKTRIGAPMRVASVHLQDPRGIRLEHDNGTTWFCRSWIRASA